MATFSSIEDVLEYLEQIPTFAHKGGVAAKFGCESIRRFLERIGSPHLAYPTLHIAGTNGKGTTSRLLASALWGSGLNVGINTSPHLISYHERIQIGKERITDHDLLQFFKQVGHLPELKVLTYFELMTSVAFWYFARQKVDIAIIETGLGGRLDATNVVLPICTAITSISLDHTELLGDTIEQIAREKGGICKPGIPLVIGQLPQGARVELAKIANENQSNLIQVTDLVEEEESSSKVSDWLSKIKSDAELQLTQVENVNLPVVLTSLNEISTSFSESINYDSIKKGLKNRELLFPSRATFTKISTSKEWYYDGAHNEESLRFLCSQLETIAPLSEWTLVCTFMKDKLRPELMPILAQFEKRYFFPLDSARSATYENLLDTWEFVFPGTVENTFSEIRVPLMNPLPPVLMENIMESKRRLSDELVIFTGSFYFYETLMITE